MFNRIKRVLSISLLKYLKYNYFCKNVVRNNGHKLIPYRNSVIVISTGSKLVLDGDLHLNCNKIGNSKAEAYLVLNGNATMQVKGDAHIRFGSTIQVNSGAVLEMGKFSCNANINIQCNKCITFGDDIMVGRNVVIYDSAYHPTGTSISNMEISQKPVIIGNHVWLGANSVVMQGTVINDGAVIGTNACVSGVIDSCSFTSPTFNTPSISGMLWARDMKSLAEAEKYKVDSVQTKNIDNAVIEELENKIINVLSANITSVDFTSSDALVDERKIDSLGLITVVSLLENEFKCRIPFSAVNASNFNSVHNMAVMLANLDRTENKERKEAEAVKLEKLEPDVRETEKPVVQRIFENAIVNPDDAAIIANDKETTYQELADMILSVSRWLAEKSVAEGDCVCVQAIHEDTCIAAFYAVHLLGAKLVPVEKNSAQNRIKEIADDTDCKLIISLIKEGENWFSFDDIRAVSHVHKFSSAEKIKYPDTDLPCEMIFTTGTTGKSKGVLMTHRHMSWYSYSVAESIEMKKKNRFLLTTPLNHAGGLRRTHLSLANGCCMVYIDGLSDLSKYFDYIEKYKVTSLYLPPVAIRILMTRTGDELKKYRNQIDFVYSSSSPLPISDCEELSRLLPYTRLYNAYEASETPGVSVYNYNTENVLKNCIGSANSGVEINILTESGEFTDKPNIQGQICVKSKMNMKEYYNEPELTKEVWNNGFFVSNDLGYLDEAGNVYFAGRKGDVINIGGYKIAPSDVEEAALRSGMINECICIEAFDEFKVPYLKLLVVVNDNTAFNSNKLGEFLTDNLEAYKVPRIIEITDKVEKTFNGKINRKAYR